jgi:prevent-host-death family protein
MAAAGIRELRQRASELLGRVARGETIQITDRGRPVALLSPLPAGSRLDQLRAAGEIESATDSLADSPEPLVLAPGVEPPSEVLARLRSDER